VSLEVDVDQSQRAAFLETMRTDPAFAAEVRAIVLPQELLEMPAVAARMERELADLTETVRTLVEVVTQSSRDIGELRSGLADLTETVRTLRRELAGLTETVRTLVEVVAQNSRDIAELRRELAGLTETVRTLVEVVAQNTRDVGGLGLAVSSMLDMIGQLTELVRASQLDLRQGVDELREPHLELGQEVRQGFATFGARLDQLSAEVRELRRGLDGR
jgi:chromosome segregation ATPase